jgi:riboflavin kinase/FMN adenylyltransferase
MRVVAVGRFDGVHRGHQHLLSVGRRIAEREGLRLCAYTFPPRGEVLLPLAAKERLLRGLCDEVVVRPWEEIEHLSPRDFVYKELVEGLSVSWVVLGPDHRFGHGAAGDVGLLRELGEVYGFSVRVVEPLVSGGRPVSSRRIRALVREGRVEEAGELLGRPHVLFGERVPGMGLARKLGFPTVNLKLLPEIVRPRAGVYTAWAHWREGSGRAVFYYGPRSTFPSLPPTAELHLLSSPRAEPRGMLEVALIGFIRPAAAFPSARELSRAIAADVARARELLEGTSPPAPVLVGPGGGAKLPGS